MIEQLKTIREDAEWINNCNTGGMLQGRARNILAALTQLEAMVGAQQPVAYYYQKHNCFGQLVWNVGFVAPGDATHCYPLYTAAPVAQQPQARPDFTDEWTGYLKDGETPFERFLRERKDVQSALKLYQRALEENERLKAQQPQAEAVPTVQVVNCDTCKHSANSCDDYPCNRCGVEFGDGPFNRWEAPQQAEAVPPDVVRDAAPIPDHELVTMYDERPTSDLEMIEFAREVERRHGIGVQPQHITDGSPCWCNPDVAYTDPETGASVIVHRRPQ